MIILSASISNFYAAALAQQSGHRKFVKKGRFPAWTQCVFRMRFDLKTQVRKSHMKVILNFADAAARCMVKAI
jgi:hypothetical protein